MAEQVKGACWLRLRRQAHTRLDGVDDANVRFFVSVMCLVSTCSVPLYSSYTLMPPKSYHSGKHAARLQPRCCSALHCCTALRLRSLFAFSLSASPVRIAAECPPSVWARLIATVIGRTLQFPAILQYSVASALCSGKPGQGQQDCAIFDAAEVESVGVEEAITAACGSSARLFGIDRASRGTV